MPNAQCPMPNAQCPMPDAQCPMPNALCPVVPHLSEKGDIIGRAAEYDAPIAPVQSANRPRSNRSRTSMMTLGG